MSRIGILGAGGWGIAFGMMCLKNGHTVNVWTPFENERDAILKNREHKALLKNIKIPEAINVTR